MFPSLPSYCRASNPSSKASGVGMGFLNQSTLPWGIQSLASTVYWSEVVGGVNASCGKNRRDDAY